MTRLITDKIVVSEYRVIATCVKASEKRFDLIRRVLPRILLNKRFQKKWPLQLRSKRFGKRFNGNNHGWIARNHNINTDGRKILYGL